MTNIITTELEIDNWFEQLGHSLLIDLWIQDPPYPFDEKNGTGRYKGMYQKFDWKKLENIFQNMYNHTADGGRAYVFCNRDGLLETTRLLEEAGFKYLNWLIWDKQAFGGGYHWRNQAEFLVYVSKGKPKVYVKGISNILNYPRPKKSDIVPGIGYNPTGVSAKPQQIWRDILEWGAVEGDICADPFAGTNPMRAALLLNPHLQKKIKEAHTNVYLT